MTEKTFRTPYARWSAAIAAVDAWNCRPYDPAETDEVAGAQLDTLMIEVNEAANARCQPDTSSITDIAARCRILHEIAADYDDPFGWIPDGLLPSLIAAVARDAAALAGLEYPATPQG